MVARGDGAEFDHGCLGGRCLTHRVWDFKPAFGSCGVNLFGKAKGLTYARDSARPAHGRPCA